MPRPSSGPSDGERGSSRIDVLLDYVTAEQVTALSDRIADLCVEFGLACDEEDDPVKALIAVRGYEWPENLEDLIKEGGELSGASHFLVPSGVKEGHIE